MNIKDLIPKLIESGFLIKADSVVYDILGLSFRRDITNSSIANKEKIEAKVKSLKKLMEKDSFEELDALLSDLNEKLEHNQHDFNIKEDNKKFRKKYEFYWALSLINKFYNENKHISKNNLTKTKFIRYCFIYYYKELKEDFNYIKIENGYNYDKIDFYPPDSLTDEKIQYYLKQIP